MRGEGDWPWEGTIREWGGREKGREERRRDNRMYTHALLYYHTLILSHPHPITSSPLTQCGEEFTALYNGKEKHYQFKRRFPPGSLALFRVKACNSVGWR